MEILLKDYFVENSSGRVPTVRTKLEAILASLEIEVDELVERVADCQETTTRTSSSLKDVDEVVRNMVQTARKNCLRAQNAQLRNEADLAFIDDVMIDIRDKQYELETNSHRPEYLHHGVLVLTEEISKARIAECKAKSDHAALTIPHNIQMDSPEWEAFDDSATSHRAAQLKLQSLSDTREHLRAIDKLENFEPGTAVETRIPGMPMHPRNEQPRILPANSEQVMPANVIGIHKAGLMADLGLTLHPPKHATLRKDVHGYRGLGSQWRATLAITDATRASELNLRRHNDRSILTDTADQGLQRVIETEEDDAVERTQQDRKAILADLRSTQREAVLSDKWPTRTVLTYPHAVDFTSRRAFPADHRRPPDTSGYSSRADAGSQHGAAPGAGGRASRADAGTQNVAAPEAGDRASRAEAGSQHVAPPEAGGQTMDHSDQAVGDPRSHKRQR